MLLEKLAFALALTGRCIDFPAASRKGEQGPEILLLLIGLAGTVSTIRLTSRDLIYSLEANSSDAVVVISTLLCLIAVVIGSECDDRLVAVAF